MRSGVQIETQRLGDEADEGRNVSVQGPQLGLLGDASVGGDLVDLGDHSDRIEVEEADQQI